MKIEVYNTGEKSRKVKLPKKTLIWVQVTNLEALELIESLTHQVRSGNPNEGRAEFNGQPSFSIAVVNPLLAKMEK